MEIHGTAPMWVIVPFYVVLFGLLMAAVFG